MSRRWGCGGSARSGAVPRACVRCSARYLLPFYALARPLACHQAILRVLYAYFSGLRREECVDVSIPLNTVIKITPTAQGFDEERFHPVEPESLEPHLLDPASH